MERNDDGLFDRVLDDVECRNEENNQGIHVPCKYFKLYNENNADTNIGLLQKVNEFSRQNKLATEILVERSRVK